MKKKTKTKPKTLELRSLTVRTLSSTDLEMSQWAVAGGVVTDHRPPTVTDINSGCGN